MVVGVKADFQTEFFLNSLLIAVSFLSLLLQGGCFGPGIVGFEVVFINLV